MQARLFPASTREPQTAFTVNMLKCFQLHNLESKKAAYDYLGAIRRLTDNSFTADVPSPYAAFLRVVRVFNYLTLKKRTGQLHGIDAFYLIVRALEVAPASSPEWDSLNLEYPPGVTDQIYTTAPPPSPEWDGLQLEYPPEVSHPRDQIEKTRLTPAPPPAPGHTGNAGDAATPENDWTEAETAVFGRADPADDEWTDEESNQTGVVASLSSDWAIQ
ncbi:hypothetical protein B0H10DRAFT_2225674 [Mycena sp. CBHHK59/15]|nr:hypothetical protein B0H10DRAFT_2225674 [Mycena sp. CBHHK59/15]